MPAVAIALLLLIGNCLAQAQQNTNTNKFRQLGTELPTPNVYRTASGAPGHEYWQQRADYDISVKLDDERQVVTGSETVTYYNQSPDVLKYLWLQLDQNVRAKDADKQKIKDSEIEHPMKYKQFKELEFDFDGGFNIEHVQSENGKDLPYTIQKTMMRIDLPEPLKPGEQYSFKVKWWYNINDRMDIGGRSGYEYFPRDDNYLYTIAQFYPRMCVYSEFDGWSHKQFLGRGEFALTFGDFDVKITVPGDHVVAATGELQNPGKVLTSKQQKRLKKAAKADEPVFIITKEEADAAEQGRAKEMKTWHFKATNVRDFGFASSRKFMWDAMGVKQSGRTIMAMSYYPQEGVPLWDKYSTKVIAQTIKTYSHHTFDYPYPVAISVHAKSIGMEYPMICFNFGRPEADGSYSKYVKYRMIGVIIHEIGHNYFPMIVNSDERQWAWMDEGMNTFLQYLTEQQWERGFPSRRGPAYKIADYMGGDKSNIMPMMTDPQSIPQLGNNAYGKPAATLNILRETVMGREAFDFAFREFAQRWKFKHPTPADFFRTMEDASGIDLDWFWRGWFYTNDHVDIAITGVKWMKLDLATYESKPGAGNKKTSTQKKPRSSSYGGDFISDMRNASAIKETAVERDPSLADFYNGNHDFELLEVDPSEMELFSSKLTEEEKEAIDPSKNYYEIGFENIGGLVMPLILEFEFVDGSKILEHIPAEIWALDNEKVSKVFVFENELKKVFLDPYRETADTDMSNNSSSSEPIESRFQLYKKAGSWDRKGPNAMQKFKAKQ